MKTTVAILVCCVGLAFSHVVSSSSRLSQKDPGNDAGSALRASASRVQTSSLPAPRAETGRRAWRSSISGLAALLVLTAGMAFGSFPNQSAKLARADRIPSAPASNNAVNWMDLYTAAYMEREPAKMAERIAEAEKAITERWDLLRAKPQPSAGDEERSLAEALHNLRVLREMQASNRA